MHQVGLSPSEYGLVVSSFGLSKLLGNIPAAYYVDIAGRKPAMVTGLAVCAVGLGALSLVLVAPPPLVLPLLLSCRFCTGAGVSAFTAGAFVMMTDVSTALNRSRTMAPIMASFQAGIALGPFAGGQMIEKFGIPFTYLTCGAAFAVISAANHIGIHETILKKQTGSVNVTTSSSSSSSSSSSTAASSSSNAATMPTFNIRGVFKSFSTASTAWRALLKIPDVRDVCMLQTAYWMALAGVQMTTLPLFMVSDTLHMGAAEIGQSFAIMSVCSVLTSQPSAYCADKVGKIPTTLVGAGLVTASMMFMPYASTSNELLGVLVPLSVGSCILQSIPTAYLADLIPAEQRSQGLSLLRTCGDVGLLVGATVAGLLVDATSFASTIHANSALMMAAMTLWGARRASNFMK